MSFNEADVFGKSTDFCGECGECGHHDHECPDSGVVFLGEVVEKKIEPLFIGFEVDDDDLVINLAR